MTTTHIKDQGGLVILSATIANSAQVTEEIAVPAGYIVTRVITPASYDGGNISFSEAHTSGGTYFPVHDSGDASTASAVMIINTPAAEKSYVINPTVMVGQTGFLKLDTANTVSAEREITLLLQKTSL
tara:strand:- start:244 stop:627 length:384 start_codon:yes stop_codon:yes gene_type:complete